MSKFHSKAAALRAKIAESSPIKVIGAHNGLSAKLGERAGFDAIWASGLEVSVSHAVPDAGILTMTDFLRAATNMNESTTVPIICDCDTGYGNSNNVIHMVRNFERAGIAAVCMEDKQTPKVNSFVPGRQDLANVAEFVGKITAAKNAQETEDFVVIARVEALIAGWGLKEARVRAHAYADAGADLILMHSKSTEPDEIVAFCKSWERDTPIVLVPTTYPTLTHDKIKELGNVGVVIYANHGIRAAVKQTEIVMEEIYRTGSTLGVVDKITTMKNLFELQGMPKFKEDEAQFGLKKARNQAIVLAAGRHGHGKQFEVLLKETPIVNLDINGRSLLDRNLETLREAAVTDITVVAGFHQEKVDRDGIRVAVNEDWEGSGNLGSFLTGLQHVGDRTVVVYGDIVLDSVLLKQALEQRHDVCLVVDAAVAKEAEERRSQDFVRLSAAGDIRRDLDFANQATVTAIGKDLELDGSTHEFTGIIVLSREGVAQVRELAQAAAKEFADKPFGKAENFAKASMNDFIAYLIDQKVRVAGWPATGGWYEIHDFSDYQAVCQTVARAQRGEADEALPSGAGANARG
ncbi:MAG: isocitrate lyase/phosphoenolpyruvate mutase family protein [Myxococcota bacterium]